jgi:acetoin utilization protein AcuC
MPSARTAIAHPLGLPLYDLGEGHPMTTVRYRLALELIRAYGLLERPDVDLLEPRPATVEEITRVHAPAYVRAVRRYSDDPMLGHSLEARQWGLTPSGDTPPVEGLHDRAAAVCGVALAAARAVWEGRAQRAIAVGGGLHHAFANRAAGFCVYNDPAVAIQALLDAGCERVAFVDVDAHHGDGTQFIFYDDPRVLTCSVHEEGTFLFPGTGWLEERGAGDGQGTAINVPLPAFAGDAPYVRAVEEVVAPAVLAFRPQALVIEPGWDGYHADVLTHLQITLDGFARVNRLLGELAQEATGGRMIVIGGGGYTGDILARGTTLLVAEMLGVDLPDEIPAGWRALARELTGQEPNARLRGEVAFEAPVGQRAAADARAAAVIGRARALVGALRAPSAPG